MSSMLDWAKREVEIACKKENPNRKEGEFDYGCACYESALKAFESLCEDGHSGCSIKITQAILNRLIDGQPLTPIEDTDDIWNIRLRLSKDGLKMYQCKRMGPLFKKIYDDGTVRYDDINRVCCIDIHDSDITYHFGLVDRIIDEMFPITMPYMPGDPIKVYCEDFSINEKNGMIDIVGILYALKTENGKQERIEINRFFRETENDEDGSKYGKMIEISKEEYYKRTKTKFEELYLKGE